MNQNIKPLFRSSKAFERKFKEYIRYCKSDGVNRLPNTAGFCCYCNIKRSDFLKMKNLYPLEFDVAMSTLLDESLNTKVTNTSATIGYIHNEINGYIDNSDGDVEIICEHDSFEDGE